MIIGKDDKYMVEELKRKIERQDDLIKRLHEKIDKLCCEIDDEASISFLNTQIKDYKEREKELLTIIKAIISKFGTGEIVVRKDEILNAKDLRLIKQREYMSDGHIYRIVSEKQILDSYKEEQ